MTQPESFKGNEIKKTAKNYTNFIFLFHSSIHNSEITKDRWNIDEILITDNLFFKLF